MNLKNIKDSMLIKAFEEAKQKELASDFLNLLKKELIRRNISH
ncbi:sporulation histidine kinase inhibitor Sda [Shouchella miscanthi]|uniref:Sporulation histidine kinase inhibitor Sda n=1 Tax=Shouchella miscanthi TaxID=2598861 RepID=A0ABU6NE88_9BACI|nr:sporulation histidine kinase inhibitor Sda [Shouchella miscanthi]